MRFALGRMQAQPVADDTHPPKTGLFRVIARIGNVDAKHTKRCYIRYYPTGKPEAEDDAMPFIYSYYDNIPKDLAISQDSSLT